MATPTESPTQSPTFTFAPTSFPTLEPDGESIFVQMNTYIAAVVVLLFLGCVFIVNGYKEPNFPWYTQVSTVVGYFCTIGIMILVPIDVATVVISRRYNYHDPEIHRALASTYNAFFIVVLVLSNAWLCIEEYVNTDGYFTPLSRLWSSLKRFTFDTIVMTIVGLILLGILISQKAVPSNSKGLMTTIQIVTGIMYQFFLVMLLAYGLIQYPISFWKCSNLDDYYTIVQMEISEEVKGISDSMLNASLAVSDVLKTKDALLNGDNKDAAKNEELQNAMKILLSECPEEFRSSRLGKVACDPKTGKVTIDTLAELRTKLNMTKSIYKMSQTKCAKTRILAYKLEDIIAARDKNAGVITWTLQGTYSTAREKNWLCVYRGWVWKICAVLLFLLSLLSFIGICALYPSVNMTESPYFKAINDPRNNLGAIVIFIWFTFGYTLYITLWSLFQMSFAGLMDLAPGSTTPQALSFNVRMVARLAAPLAFFYLGWIGENGMRDGDWTQKSDCQYVDDTQINEHCVLTTAFSSFYQIASVKAVKNSIGVIFPSILIVFALLMLTGVLNKILVYCKLGDFQIGHRIATDDLLREGKKHLQKEKKSTIKMYQKGLLRSGLFSVNRPDNDQSFIGKLIGFYFGKKVVKGLAYEDNLKDSEISKESSSDRFAKSLSNIDVKRTPMTMAGVVGKKEGALKGSWNELYCKLENGASLKFWRQVKAPAATTKPDLTFDLKLAMQFLRKQDKDGNQLEITFSSEVIRMRFKTESELDKWKDAAEEWKRFALENPDFDYEEARPQTSKISDLETINVDDLEYGGKGSSKYRSGSDNGEESGLVSDKPDRLEGWIEKKSESKMGLGSEWQKRFVRIDERTGSMVYYKTANTSDKPAGTIDLRLVMDISAYSKGGAKEDPSRFNVDMGDNTKVYKWKAASIEEGIKWTKGLNDWRDHFLLEMK